MHILKFIVYLSLTWKCFAGVYKYQSYSHNVVCTAKKGLVTPSTDQQVLDVVLTAVNQSRHIKVLTSHHHSITDILCTNGIAISLTNFQNYKLNKKNSIVTVGAGMALSTFLELLDNDGYAIENMPSYGGITVGGLLGTGAHGSSLKRSVPADLLVRIKVITGQLPLRIQYISNKDDLKAFKTHLGALAIKDNDKWNLITDVNARQILTQGAIFEQIQATSNNSVLCAIESQLALSRINTVSETQVPLYTMINPTVINNMTGYGLLRNPATGYSHNMLNAKCTYCAWNTTSTPFFTADYSFIITVERLGAVTKDIAQILNDYGHLCFPLGTLFRYLKHSDGLLTLSGDNANVNYVAFEFVLFIRKHRNIDTEFVLAGYEKISQMLRKKYNARPHWGKNGPAFFTQGVHSGLKKFYEKKQKYDPKGLFDNNLLRRLF
ncbi:unnamed protein product, partial [Didymodactylos carnosus]